jgi:putative membrane protein
MIRNVILAAGAASLCLAAAAQARPANGSMQSGEPMQASGQMEGGMTADFIKKAARSDEFERQEGRLAETRAHNPQVRKFAAMMVSAHTKTTEGLKAAIRKAGMTPPPPPPLTDDQMHMMADLKGMHGADFDKTYIDQQVQAHQETLGVVQGYADNGQPGPIKMAAEKTVPIVQHHLELAKGLQSHMGG